MAIQGQPVDGVLARVVDRGQKTAVQLIENLAREDLNAYEKAIGIQELKRELGADAQWGDVEKILRMSRSQRARIIRVLKLPDTAVKIIQTHSLSERKIRPIFTAFSDQPVLLEKAFGQLEQQLIAGDDGDVKQIIADLQIAPLPSSGTASSATVAGKKQPVTAVKKFQQFEKFLKKGGGSGELSEDERASLVEIRALIDQILG
jgi:ParB-like chromosome segregation protein Spo0J